MLPGAFPSNKPGGWKINDVLLLHRLALIHSLCQDNQGKLRPDCRLNSSLQDQTISALISNVAAASRHTGESSHHLIECKNLGSNNKAIIRFLAECAEIGNWQSGVQAHSYIILCDIKLNVFIGSALINMYAKFGSLEDAYKVFETMAEHDVVSWNAMITGYSKHGHAVEALNLYWVMTNDDKVKPTNVTFVSALNACARMKYLECGRQIHAYVIQSEHKIDIVVLNSLMDMYNKCTAVEDACQIFCNLRERDVVSWNVMIAACAKSGPFEHAFMLFQQMKHEAVEPNEFTIVGILSACSSIRSLEQGKQIQAIIETSNDFKRNTNLSNLLLDLYACSGSMLDAHQLFEKISKSNAVSWNVLINANAKIGNAKEALSLFARMDAEGVKPNEVTFLILCSVCESLDDLKMSNQLYFYIIYTGTYLNTLISNALVDMYGRCGSLKDARFVFENIAKKDVISWTTIIASYAQHNGHAYAWACFDQMQWEGVYPNEVTFMALLTVVSSVEDLQKGKQLQCQMIHMGIKPSLSILNTLIDMYAKCGSLKSAREMFDGFCEHDIVSWNAIISGYVKYGFSQDALQLFSQMQNEGTWPDEVTFMSILNACANLPALQQGKHIHTTAFEIGLDLNPCIGTVLIDMYAKCGNLNSAHQALDRLSVQDVGSWSAMITAYAHHGHGKEALQMADQMQGEGMKLNIITLLGILSACNHAGLVNEGCYFFDIISHRHGVELTTKHYACMVDLLGRAGQFKMAEYLIEKMSLQPSAALWMALLSACRFYGNIELAKRAGKKVLELEPHNAAPSLVLSAMQGSCRLGL